MTWRIGMKAVCVNNKPISMDSRPWITQETREEYHDALSKLYEGEVYTVRDVREQLYYNDDDGNHCRLGLLLEEIVNIRRDPLSGKGEYYYAAMRFRSVQDVVIETSVKGKESVSC